MFAEWEEVMIQEMPIKGELKAKLVTPQKMFLYWDASDIPKKIIQSFFHLNFDKLVPIVRIYDVTEIIFNGKNAHHFYEVSISYQQGFWFIKGLTANRSYVAELGVYVSETSFFPIFRSTCIHTPSADIPLSNELYQDVLQFKRYEEEPPKWRDYVSTYSYYVEKNRPEENNA
ncbi:DUF4912 domain-containing protein [Neobacillus thermocopriae]|nr:DUF4912 domain-containing protein [Neobacillus thermocopriae]